MTYNETVPQQPSHVDIADSVPRRHDRLRRVAWGILFATVAVATAASGVCTAWLVHLKRDAGEAAESDLRVPEIALPPVPPDRESADFLLADEPPLPAGTRQLIDEANAVVEQLVEAFPNDLDCLEMKARAEDWQGKSEAAVATWQECLTLNPRYIHAHVGMAAVAAKKGDHRKAAELARTAVQIDPTSFQARDILAEALINLQQPAEAVEVLDSFLQKDPRSHGFFLLGQAYAQLEQLDKARLAYEAAVAKYPRYAEAHYALARVQLRLGQREEAQQTMAAYWELMKQRKPTRQGMESTKDDFQETCVNGAILYTDIGRIYFARQRPRRAEWLWRRAAALDPHNVPCRQMLALLCRSEGRLWEALQVIEQLALIDGANIAYHLEAGQLYASSLQFEQAELAFATACEVAPEAPEGYAALVRLYLTAGRKTGRALQMARNLVQKAPTAANYALLAAACRQNGDHQEALAAINRARELAPQEPAYQRMYQALQPEQ